MSVAKKSQSSAICINQAYGSVSVVGQGVQTCPPTARAVVPRATNPSQPRSVLVTPLSGYTVASSVTPNQSIDKVLLKAESKVGKAGSHKMFTLRNINTGIVSRDDVKRAIKSQLQGDIVAGEFDVGIVSGGNVISIRSEADVKEFWADIRMGRKAVLWCDGLKEKPTESTTSVKCKKRKGTSGVEVDVNESDEDTSQTVKRPAVKKRKTAQEEREERVQNTIEELKEKHGASFTPMQVQIWAKWLLVIYIPA